MVLLRTTRSLITEENSSQFQNIAIITKGPGAKNDTSKSPGCFNQILTFESRKWSPIATF